MYKYIYNINWIQLFETDPSRTVSHGQAASIKLLFTCFFVYRGYNNTHLIGDKKDHSLARSAVANHHYLAFRQTAAVIEMPA